MGILSKLKVLIRHRRPRVVVSLDGVTYESGDGRASAVLFSELERITIRTTSDGPFAEDVFYVLEGTSYAVEIPQGAVGNGVLFSRLQELPGFNNDAVIDAMVSVREDRFVCWEKPQSPPDPLL